MSPRHGGPGPRRRRTVDATRQVLIRRLNDHLRRFWLGGRVMVTRRRERARTRLPRGGARGGGRVRRLRHGERPHGEHDFGALTVAGVRLLWKVDYYDAAMTGGSPDPADPSVTTRVLTVMLAHEW